MKFLNRHQFKLRLLSLAVAMVLCGVPVYAEDAAIAKTAVISDPLGGTPAVVAPGDTISYSISIGDNSAAGEFLHGIDIEDALPAGVENYTGIGITGAQTVRLFRDNIETGDGFAADAAASGNDGNTSFSGDWVETSGNGGGEGDGAGSGDEIMEATLGRYVIRIRDDNGPANDRGEGVYRVANLASCPASILSFEIAGDGIDNGGGDTGGDGIYLEESIDGVAWTELVRFDPDGISDANSLTDNNRDLVNNNFDAHAVSLGVASATSYIRFITDDDNGNTDGALIDNVQITAICGVASPSIGTPPNLLASTVYAGFNYGLDTGSLVVTYSVEVSEGRETDITNDALVRYTDLVGNANTIGGTEVTGTNTSATNTVTLTLRDDFGDAPETEGYTTLLINNGPRHVRSGNLFLGDVVADLDSGGFTDGSQGAGDGSEDDAAGDEGVSQLLTGLTAFPSLSAINSNYSITLDYTNSTGSTANLLAWIDFDADGNFDEDERAVSVGLASTGAASTTLNWSNIGSSGPDILEGITYARFRLTTDVGLVAGSNGGEDEASVGFANNGEVEDYQIVIVGADYGDAPNSYGDAAHGLSSNLYLGPAQPDQEADTQLGGDAGVGADGDDGDGNDDESTLASIPSLTTGATSYSLSVTIINSTGDASADLFGWIDFDNNGTFEATEGVTVNTPSTGTYELSWTVPGSITLGDTFIRLRLTSDASVTTATPNGSANDGEVEDYAITISAPLDYGDAIDTGLGTAILNYRTGLADDGARHLLDADLFLGDTPPDADSDAYSNGAATGDENNAIADEGQAQLLTSAQGNNFPVYLVSDSTYSLNIDLANTTGSAANLYAWIDFDHNGSFDEDEIANGGPVSVANNATDATLIFSTTADAAIGNAYMRLRLTSDSLTAAGGGEDERSYGLANSGEVEDYRLILVGLDFADAPDTYGTDRTNSLGEGIGPSHQKTGTLYIGSDGPDVESDGLPSPLASGDDTDTEDDEGGFYVPVIATLDTSYSLTVPLNNNTGTTATLFGWLDFEADGDFTGTNEGVSVSVPSGATSAVLNWPAFTAIPDSQTFVRLRLTTDAAITTATPGGPAFNGEVEDRIVIVGALDFGDAPDTYSTDTIPGNGGGFDGVGPSHAIISNLYIGDIPDGEANGQISADASGDGFDEDNSFVSPPVLLTPASQSYSLNINVTNTTTADAELVGWIDFDGNGFYDSDETATVAVADSDTSAILSWTVIPGDITPGDTFLRLRLTSDPRVATGIASTSSPKGVAANGEVEDHSISISVAYDYGDAPDSYGTDSTDGGEGFGPRHIVSPILFIGPVAADAEIDGQPSVDGLLDDNTGVGEDTPLDSTDGDEGDLFLTTIQPSATSYTVNVPLTNATASNATLYGWLDINQNGVFDGGVEAQTTTVLPGASFAALTFTWTTAGNTSGGNGLDTGNTFLRLRLSTDTGLGATQATAIEAAADGEVSDYSILVSQITCDLLYGIYNNGGFERLREFDNDTVDLTTTPFETAGIGIDRNYRRFYYIEWVDTGGGGDNQLNYYNAATDTHIDTGAGLTPAGDNFNRMAFSYSGRGAIVESASYDVHLFDPTVSGIGQAITAGIPVINEASITGGGGDIAFDRDDNLYLLSYTTGGGANFYLYEIRFFLAGQSGTGPEIDVDDLVLTGSPETTYEATATFLISEGNPTGGQIAGMAFNFDNLIYLQGSGGQTFTWDVGITATGGTGAISPLGTSASGSADLASCIYPYIRAIIEPVKTVTNATSGGTGFIPGDQLDYTIVVRNSGGFPSFDTIFQDDIPAGTTYVPNSTSMNGNSLPDTGGLMPFIVGREINTAGQADGVVSADITPGLVGDNEVVIKFSVRADEDSGVAQICNQGYIDFEANLSPSAIPTNNPGTGAPSDATCRSQTSGFKVSGTLFEDYNVDGVKSVGEPGIPGVSMVLYNSTTGICKSVRTNTSGFYQFNSVTAGPKTIYERSGSVVPVPAVCPPSVGIDPSGYLSSTSNSRAIYVVNSNITDVDFGDVRQPLVAPNLQGVVTPGNIQTYSHLFTAPTDGAVSFTALSTASPALTGWTSTIFSDLDCSGDLTSGDSIITGNLSLVAGESVCFINRVFAPSLAAAGNTMLSELTATFNYEGALVSDQLVTANDRTTVLDAGQSALRLTKRVQNITQASTEFDTDAVISNAAKPGDRLRYEINFSNTGVANITDVNIYDAIPAFTELAGILSLSCDYSGPAWAPLEAIVPPTIMTSCALVTPAGGNNAIGYRGTLHWQLTGTLRPGESGLIVFTVDVK